MRNGNVKVCLNRGILILLFGGWILLPALRSRAEKPGEFRPQPCLAPGERVSSSGDKIQPVDSLPQSRAAAADPVRKPKLACRATPAQRGNELVLNAGWELIEAGKLQAAGSALSQPGLDTRDWYDATVPGTVLGTLVEQGIYPDPCFGLNNLQIPESLNQQDYWYRTEFSLPASFAGRELWLQFNGINYYAEIWFNGAYLGHITGAFIRGGFDVTALARPAGTNVVAVMVCPPPDPGIPSEQSVKFGPGDNGGKLCLDGPTFMCTEGWDWIPAIRDRCTGLWQDVLLRASGPVTLADPQVVTSLPLPDTSSADVSVRVELRNSSRTVQRGTLRGRFENVAFEQPVVLEPGEVRQAAFSSAEFPQLVVKQPRLWWPNGYGKPELYDLQLSFIASNQTVSDEQRVRFGIRELSYELAVETPRGKRQRVEFTPTAARKEEPWPLDVSREALGWDPRQYRTSTAALRPGGEHSPALRPVDDPAMGPYLVIKVNGQRILCQGGNWGMDDALKRVSREKLEPYVRLHRDANLTMIRNWAGQSTSEVFYQLCDEYGILVWNDFWMNTEGANYAPADSGLLLANVADTLRRFRNHPCIALWCGRNEGVPPEPLNTNIGRLIQELDSTRYYQPNSRLVNLCTSGPWSNEPLEKYFTNLNQGFSTELGASSIPSMDAMRAMMAPEDLWPPGDVWAYHDFHSRGAGERGAVLRRIARRYGEAVDLADLCRKAQMVNYETYRAMYEGFNSRLWKSCSGVLVWMSHPSWPSTVWQFYSWDYEPNAAFFGAQHAAEPVHIQMNLPDCQIAVINHGAKVLDRVTAQATVYNLQGRLESTRKRVLSAAANACTDAERIAWPAQGTHFARLELYDRDGRLLSENFYWHAKDESQLKQLNSLPLVPLKGEIQCEAGPTGQRLRIRLSNRGAAPALAVKLTLRDAQTGQRILPAYYSDNYVCLLPGEVRDLSIDGLPAAAQPEVDLDGWNVEPAQIRADNPSLGHS
jgi:hypothetical protein